MGKLSYYIAMAISWVAKKKFIYLSIPVLIILIPVVFLVWQNWPRPSCVDNKQNQQEEGVDCGGPCTPCVAKPVEMVTHWVKPFKISEGRYDVAALMENTNANYAIKNLEYQFKVYDSSNILIGQKKGSTFVNPQEKFLIFEANIDTGLKVPARAFLDIEEGYNSKWEYVKKDKPSISIVSKKFINEPFARFEVLVKNNLPTDIDGLTAGGVLLDKNNNAFAASITSIGTLKGDSAQLITFTWPKPFLELPALDEIYLRANLTK